MKKLTPFFFSIAFCVLALELVAETEKPNIIVIYADDIGYGDFSCYGGTGVSTPNVDRLAEGGVRFLSAHSSSATCTPSRYSLLTGQFAFRKKAQILPGNAPLIIDPEKTNLPNMLQDAGYRTGLIGKWHLGLGSDVEPLDWNGDIKPGPREVGFDYSFHIAATGDRVPSVYIENGRIVAGDKSDPVTVSYKGSFAANLDLDAYRNPIGGEPTGISHPEQLKVQANDQHSGTIVNGISRIGTMTGGHAARFEDEDMGDTFLAKAIEFVESSSDQPFFLYYAAIENHVPRAPHPRFVGSSSLGPRGDAIAQFDWSVGELVDRLEASGKLDSTLIIISSDNGPVLFDGYRDGAYEKNGSHRPAGPYRGSKYSMYEGGTRAPFIVHWPDEVSPGISNALFSQVDLAASIAGLLDIDVELPSDSRDLHEALLGKDLIGGDYIIEEALGNVGVRDSVWKYIPAGEIRQRLGTKLLTPIPVPEPGWLFNLVEDPYESNDLAALYPEVLARLKAVAESARSTSDH